MSKITNAEKAAALLSVATVMLQDGCCAAAAAHNTHDARRIAVMGRNGVDLKRAEELVECDLAHLIEE